MDDPATNENPQKDFNKIDLTQLQGFSFGTQWTQDKAPARDQRRDDRPRRDHDSHRDERQDAGAGGEVRRDRRGFKRPAGPVGDSSGGQPPMGGGQPREGGAPRREFRGGPRRDGGEGRFSRGPRFGGREGGPQERGPYISPFFNVTFYPEDVGFTALAKAIRTSCRTYELFEIARVIIGKNDRFVAVIQRKAAEGADSGVPVAGGSAPATPPPAGAKPAPMAMSVPDGLPFETEDAAIAHVLSKHLGLFFDSAEVEVEPPKGNFQVINKCSITGELLGPPNYHRYNQIVQQHFTARISRMPFEVYRSRIESVRDPEVVNQWLEKMKKTTRYTWKQVTEGEPVPVFDNLEDARSFLLTKAKDKVVKLVESARFHGKNLELLPLGEIKRAIEGTLERQRRFPLDTANALRGRLRREGFTIFKKGSKGVSYVCAVKRKFRVPGQTFSDTIGALINFIENNPMVKASELPVKFLGIHAPEASAAAPAGATTSPLPTGGTVPPVAAGAPTTLTAEDQSRLSRLNNDLRWLVTEGYVTEFIDGRLFAPPAMTEARKQEVEKDEHDPENFPEVPAAESAQPAPAEASSQAPAEQQPAEASPAPEMAPQVAAEGGETQPAS
ncbi:hypothetical protein DB347_08360 [Opitutaceae bacterium EW11]|nr:hypothetical protein DB347_08360 [Opitutaceae bacterium EW11]